MYKRKYSWRPGLYGGKVHQPTAEELETMIASLEEALASKLLPSGVRPQYEIALAAAKRRKELM